MVDVTVIVCTYNRCEALASALNSVAVSNMPDSVSWEVIVVDNNSSDRTREVIEAFCRQYPARFHYLFEPRQGKSYALNAGIGAARGNVLAFIDDDVTVDSNWLRNLTADLDAGTWAGVGGRIVPDWPCTPPSWLPEREWLGRAPLTMFDLGLEAGPLTDAPFGANMAFHRSVFEKYGVFRTDLGPGLNSKVRNNEDTEFGRRLLAAGERLRYEPTALALHSVPPNRLTKEYFLTWWFNKGRADVREAVFPLDRKRSVSGIPLQLFRKIGVGTLKWMITLNSTRRFSCRLTVWFLAGNLIESYRQWREISRARGVMS